MKAYLAKSEIIDWADPAVAAKAAELAAGCADARAIAKNCFEYVRGCTVHA